MAKNEDVCIFYQDKYGKGVKTSILGDCLPKKHGNTAKS